MVSFFGLKIGGDKKKVQTKDGIKTGHRGCDAILQKELALAPAGFYGMHHQQDDHLARPVTSCSTSKGPSSWRATFKDLGANSSMTDLTAPIDKKQNVSRQPCHPPEPNFRNPWINSITAELPLPSAFPNASCPTSPQRPSTANARTKDSVNPSSVQSAKKSPTALPALSPLGLKINSPLWPEITADNAENQNTDALAKPSPYKQQKPNRDTIHNNGYPSPPQSDANSDQTSSPVSFEMSVLLKPAGVDLALLPSPTPSVPQTSQEHCATPVIDNVAAKRDTALIQSPRRRGFTMDLEQQELERMRKQRQTEGFTGIFADFDFGETVTKQHVIEQFPEPPASAIKINHKHDSGGIDPTPQATRNTQPIFRPYRQPQTTPKTPERIQAATSPKASQLASKSVEISPLQLVQSPKTILARPTTSHGRIGGPSLAAAASRPGNDAVTTIEPPLRLGLRARLGSDANIRPNTNVSKPLQMNPPALVPHKESSCEILSFVPTSSEYRTTTRDGDKHSLNSSPPQTPQEIPILGDFSVTGTLPRGRQPPSRPRRSDESLPDRSDSFYLPDWGVLNNAQPRQSAMPPPLMTASQPRSRLSESPVLPPSSSFASLELPISSSGESLAQAFAEALVNTSWSPALLDDSFFLDTSVGFTDVDAGTRIETKTASPQTSPVSLPPPLTKKSTEPHPSTPVRTEFSINTEFI